MQQRKAPSKYVVLLRHSKNFGKRRASNSSNKSGGRRVHEYLLRRSIDCGERRRNQITGATSRRAPDKGSGGDGKGKDPTRRETRTETE